MYLEVEEDNPIWCEEDQAEDEGERERERKEELKHLFKKEKRAGNKMAQKSLAEFEREEQERRPLKRMKMSEDDEQTEESVENEQGSEEEEEEEEEFETKQRSYGERPDQVVESSLSQLAIALGMPPTICLCKRLLI